jgi:hypothetical protein
MERAETRIMETRTANGSPAWFAVFGWANDATGEFRPSAHAQPSRTYLTRGGADRAARGWAARDAIRHMMCRDSSGTLVCVPE